MEYELHCRFYVADGKEAIDEFEFELESAEGFADLTKILERIRRTLEIGEELGLQKSLVAGSDEELDMAGRHWGIAIAKAIRRNPGGFGCACAQIPEVIGSGSALIFSERPSERQLAEDGKESFSELFSKFFYGRTARIGKMMEKAMARFEDESMA